jgi:dienelactone hydrolase
MIGSVINRREMLAASSAAVVGVGSLALGQQDRRGLSWLADSQRPPAELPADAPRLSSLVEKAGGGRISTVGDWQGRRAELRKWWLDFLGPLPRAAGGDLPTLKTIEEEHVRGVVRQRVAYESHPGWPTEAYILKPANVDSPRPGVAVFHSTVEHSIRQPAGVEGRPEVAFGLKLAERGYVAFCPRNFLWPDNHRIDGEGQTQKFHEQFSNSKGMAKMLADAILAVDILCVIAEVDARRIGSIGHSLGAKEVLYLAAFDERVQVTVSSEGGIGTRFSNWDAPWYLGPSINAPAFTHEHHELLGLVAPRAFLLLGGDSADGDRSWPFIEAALPVYSLFGDVPRIGLVNHQQGHSVPPGAQAAIYEWFDAYL